MTVTKRVRFEVLRRDEHTCQYCGRRAPAVALQIDHVVPAVLGGSDDPGNLVAACEDCNSGKASIQPDAPLVQRVSDHAAAYALGMLDRITRLRADLQREQQWVEEFEEAWNQWTYPDPATGGRKRIPLPTGWERSIVRWRTSGIPVELIDKAIKLAMEKRGLRGETPEFSYMAGVIWRTVDALEVDYDLVAEHAAVATEQEVDEARVEAWNDGAAAGYARGFDDGCTKGREAAFDTSMRSHRALDLLAHHVDGTGESSTYWRLLRGGARRGT